MEKKIDERTFEFALEIIALYKYLASSKEYVLSKQILRAGTKDEEQGTRFEERGTRDEDKGARIKEQG